jgi:outer membrane protein OmpA-like peptidoglycan-associated protein
MTHYTLHLRFLAVSLLFAYPARGGELFYGAALHEAEWQVSVSRQECRLVQEIPYYGRAVFSRKAGRELEFSLSVKQYAPQGAVAHLQSLPPAWIHTAAALDLGEVNTAQGNTPLVLPEPQARRVLAELEKGMVPTLTYKDWGDNRDNVVVAVSAINLRKSLPPFLDCLNGLLPDDFNDVRASTIRFDLASASLAPADRRRLERVAHYLLADETVKGLRLVGHTDSLGFRTANHRLSVRRTAVVRDFLVHLGIPAERIQVEHQGEKNPRFTNRTDAGRANNRRVELTLLR